MRDRVMTRGDALAMSAAVIVALTTVLYVTIIVSQGERMITRVGFVVVLLAAALAGVIGSMFFDDLATRGSRRWLRRRCADLFGHVGAALDRPAAPHRRRADGRVAHPNAGAASRHQAEDFARSSHASSAPCFPSPCSSSPESISRSRVGSAATPRLIGTASTRRARGEPVPRRRRSLDRRPR